MGLSRSTLAGELCDHCWGAPALAMESASSPNVRERYLITGSLGLTPLKGESSLWRQARVTCASLEVLI